MDLSELSTPVALIDLSRMQNNIARMQKRISSLGVKFRPHVKTAKCLEVAQAQMSAGANGITVSTLKEAEQFFAAGIKDILYAVGMAGNKLQQASRLIDKGCSLKILADSLESAEAISNFSRTQQKAFEVWIEIDTDNHRAGVKPASDDLLAIGHILNQNSLKLGGVMTHAGSSYELSTPEALVAMAEQERRGCVLAANRLRAAGLPCPNVSVGSTPTALSATQLEGVTEVRAGVYVFFDLVMANVGVCSLQDIALSVLTSVIGHQKEKGWAIVDAGWMAMSRDRGTQKQLKDYGYGQVCDLQGQPIEGFQLISANQEHGILSMLDEEAAKQADIAKRFPIGTLLRILPNHACATGAQFPSYQTISSPKADNLGAVWQRFYGW